MRGGYDTNLPSEREMTISHQPSKANIKGNQIASQIMNRASQIDTENRIKEANVSFSTQHR
jgi:hypothetical protein